MYRMNEYDDGLLENEAKPDEISDAEEKWLQGVSHECRTSRFYIQLLDLPELPSQLSQQEWEHIAEIERRASEMFESGNKDFSVFESKIRKV